MCKFNAFIALCVSDFYLARLLFSMNCQNRGLIYFSTWLILNNAVYLSWSTVAYQSHHVHTFWKVERDVFHVWWQHVPWTISIWLWSSPEIPPWWMWHTSRDGCGLLLPSQLFSHSPSLCPAAASSFQWIKHCARCQSSGLCVTKTSSCRQQWTHVGQKQMLW